MTLDASIILQGRPAQIDSPLDTYGKFLSLKGAQGELSDRETKRMRAKRLQELARQAYVGESRTPMAQNNLARLVSQMPSSDIARGSLGLQSRSQPARGERLTSNAALEDMALRGEDPTAFMDDASYIDDTTASEQAITSTAPQDFKTLGMESQSVDASKLTPGGVPTLSPVESVGARFKAPEMTLNSLTEPAQSMQPAAPSTPPQEQVNPARYDMAKLRDSLLQEGYLDEGLTVTDRMQKEQTLQNETQSQQVKIQKEKLAAVRGVAQGALLQYSQLTQSGVSPEVAQMRVQPYYEQSIQELTQSGVIDPQQAAQVPRQFNADHAMQVYLHTIDADKALDRVMPKPAAPSNLAELINERKALISKNPRDPSIQIYDQKLAKETTHQPPLVDMTQKLETKESQAKGEYNIKDYFKPIQESSFVARKSNQQLSALEGIDFNTGWGADIKAKAAAILEGAGIASDAAKQYAGNSQTFTAIVKEQVLQKQLAQKGPQTDGDAKRLESTVAALGNTPEANKFIIAMAKAQNNQDIAKAEFINRFWSQNRTLEGAEDGWLTQGGSKSIFDDPAMKKWAPPKAPEAGESFSRNAPPPPGTVKGFDIPSTLAEANRAIRAGKDANAVRDRLLKNGFPRSLLDQHLDAR